MTDVTSDVLIVGGGSAGAVLATRLSEDPARTVLLLEAGPAYPADGYPASLADEASFADPGHDWGYRSRGNETTPEIPTARGKVLGGSSAVNAAIAIRARPADFAKWAGHGIEGWSWQDVLPTFKKLENTAVGDDTLHGRTGPLAIRQRTDDDLTPSLRGFIDAAVAHGYKRVPDFNGHDQNGVGAAPVNAVDGVRLNTGMAYLTDDVRSRPNLKIRGDITVDRVLFDGTRASGVVTTDGTVVRTREVILSGGSYGSAAILLRSGIGPAADLRSLGIDVLADRPVGRRMQEHPFYYNIYALAPEHTGMAPVVGSLLWTASSEAVDGELDLHVAATHLFPGSLSPTGGAIVLATSVVQPESHGTLTLASRDALAPPRIDNNLLGTARDRRRMLEGVRLGRELAHGTVFAPFVAAEMVPGDSVDDAALPDVVAANLALYGHPVATAPMGDATDPWAVVDASGAVYGVDGLRVIDASIIPEITSAATNLTTIMLAEHLAERLYSA